MQLTSGAPFNLSGPSCSVSIEDVAASLSKINRFAGSTRVPYSVAQHSVHVAKIAKTLGGSRKEQLAGLLHDLHEIALTDMPSPVKWFLDSRQLKEFEKDIQERLQAGLSVEHGMQVDDMVDYSEKVAAADLIALATEKRDILLPSKQPWNLQLPPAQKTVIKPVGWRASRTMFLKHWEILTR